MFLEGIQFLSRGGPTMFPLVLCAIVSVTVMIERFVFLRAASAPTSLWMADVRKLLAEGRDGDALRIARMYRSPASGLVVEAIQHGDLRKDLMEMRLQEVALVETPKLSKRLNVLDTVITISPLLGLLGTVTGMIGAFHVVADPNAAGGPAAITGNVAEALIATATGLAIAIVTLVGYNALGEKVKEVVSSMELAATQVVNIYAERSQAPALEPYETSPTRA